MIKAPFTAEQVARLNSYQMWEGKPLRCKNADKHPPIYTLGTKGLMIATKDGWICPFCDHTQDFAEPHMIKSANPFANAGFRKDNDSETMVRRR